MPMAETLGGIMLTIYHYIRNILKHGLESEHLFLDSDGDIYILSCDHLRAKRSLVVDTGIEITNLELPPFAQNGEIFNETLTGGLQYLGQL